MKDENIESATIYQGLFSGTVPKDLREKMIAVLALKHHDKVYYHMPSSSAVPPPARYLIIVYEQLNFSFS